LFGVFLLIAAYVVHCSITKNHSIFVFVLQLIALLAYYRLETELLPNEVLGIMPD
jgi:hypothetical protein